MGCEERIISRNCILCRPAEFQERRPILLSGFAPKVIKCAYGAIKGNKMRRLRRRTREGCGFSSLMKQKIKAKNCTVFCFAGKRKIYFFYL